MARPSKSIELSGDGACVRAKPLRVLVRDALERLFSDANYHRDVHLQLLAEQDGYTPLDALVRTYEPVRALLAPAPAQLTPAQLLDEAVSSSSELVRSSAGGSVRRKSLAERIIAQAEYYLGSERMAADSFLMEQASVYDGWVPIATVLSFPRMRKLCHPQVGAVAHVLGGSARLEVSQDKRLVRPSLTPPASPRARRRRAAFATDCSRRWALFSPTRRSRSTAQSRRRLLPPRRPPPSSAAASAAAWPSMLSSLTRSSRRSPPSIRNRSCPRSCRATTRMTKASTSRATAATWCDCGRRPRSASSALPSTPTRPPLRAISLSFSSTSSPICSRRSSSSPPSTPRTSTGRDGGTSCCRRWDITFRTSSLSRRCSRPAATAAPTTTSQRSKASYAQLTATRHGTCARCGGTGTGGRRAWRRSAMLSRGATRPSSSSLTRKCTSRRSSAHCVMTSRARCTLVAAPRSGSWSPSATGSSAAWWWW